MLKPINPDSTVTVIWMGDPAIDADASDIDGYKKEAARDPGCWPKFIKARDGMSITRFVLGVIPSSELNRIEDECSAKERGYHWNSLQWRCFLGAMVDMVDGPTMETTDSSGRPVVKVPKTEGENPRVDKEWLSRIFVGPFRQAALDIGMIAWLWQRLPQEDIKK